MLNSSRNSASGAVEIVARFTSDNEGSVTQVMWCGAATEIVNGSENVSSPAPVENLILTLPDLLKLKFVKLATPVTLSVFAALAVTPVPETLVRAIASTKRGVMATDELTALPHAS